jgi:hypothetical protein
MWHERKGTNRNHAKTEAVNNVVEGGGLAARHANMLRRAAFRRGKSFQTAAVLLGDYMYMPVAATGCLVTDWT